MGILSPGKKIVLKSAGRCPTCDHDTNFIARETWLRDHFFCTNCGSIPRERALMLVIDMLYPDWRDLTIHESSPANRGASSRLAAGCSNYTPSQFFDGQTCGEDFKGIRCENLESLTFADETIDLHITQDVIEHIFHPSRVFNEISRTLKPGGAHIFTVPIVNKLKPSKLRARIGNDGRVAHIEEPVYHGNPISDEGSLVTVDWGFDICRHIFESCGLFTQIIYLDDLSKGIRAEYIEVLVTIKPDEVDKQTTIP